MMPYATRIEVCPAVCFCGEDAYYTIRLNNEEREVMVGGKDDYEPRCKEHTHYMNELEEVDNKYGTMDAFVAGFSQMIKGTWMKMVIGGPTFMFVSNYLRLLEVRDWIWGYFFVLLISRRAKMTLSLTKSMSPGLSNSSPISTTLRLTVPTSIPKKILMVAHIMRVPTKFSTR